ncbi:hypothetical protein ACH5RR_020378 [Cinchona calisaya]|uniref:Phytocyanin domain-containing protein n=1 Tax=Cinchona calisaya TaxID=153742 RepID=A0ABD2ZFA5_9GENT
MSREEAAQSKLRLLQCSTISSLHNIVMVDGNGYDKCSASAKAKTYSSGKDKIKLSRPGRYYFICTFPGHCDGGLKIQLNAY